MSEHNPTLNITSTPTGYIMSHSPFDICYYTPSPHTITLTDFPVDSDIVIDFIYIMLGRTIACNTPDGNAIRLYRGSDNHLIYENNKANRTLLPPPLIINTTLADYVRIDFEISSIIGSNGFLLKHYSKNIF